MKSGHFPLRRASFTDLLLKSLQEAMISSKNFKVRIAATTALGAVKESWFGQDKKVQTGSINFMLANLELAMTATDDLVGSDFGEFRYQQQLREQVILIYYANYIDYLHPNAFCTLKVESCRRMIHYCLFFFICERDNDSTIDRRKYTTIIPKKAFQMIEKKPVLFS